MERELRVNFTGNPMAGETAARAMVQALGSVQSAARKMAEASAQSSKMAADAYVQAAKIQEDAAARAEAAAARNAELAAQRKVEAANRAVQQRIAAEQRAYQQEQASIKQGMEQSTRMRQQLEDELAKISAKGVERRIIDIRREAADNAEAIRQMTISREEANALVTKNYAVMEQKISALRATEANAAPIKQWALDFVGAMAGPMLAITAATEAFNALKDTIAHGFEMNIQKENLSIGLGAVIGGMSQFSVNGKALQGAEAFAAAEHRATEALSQFNIEAAKTQFTGQQLAETAMILSSVYMGLGRNTDQLVTFTGKLATAASATAMPIAQVARETDEILQGRITTMNVFFQRFKGFLTEEEIGRIRQGGQEAAKVLETALDRLKYAADAHQHSWEGVTSTLKSVWDQFTRMATEPVFKMLEDDLDGLANAMFVGEGNARKLSPAVSELAHAVGLLGIAMAWLTVKPAEGWIQIFGLIGQGKAAANGAIQNWQHGIGEGIRNWERTHMPENYSNGRAATDPHYRAQVQRGQVALQRAMGITLPGDELMGLEPSAAPAPSVVEMPREAQESLKMVNNHVKDLKAQIRNALNKKDGTGATKLITELAGYGASHQNELGSTGFDQLQAAVSGFQKSVEGIERAATAAQQRAIDKARREAEATQRAIERANAVNSHNQQVMGKLGISADGTIYAKGTYKPSSATNSLQEAFDKAGANVHPAGVSGFNMMLDMDMDRWLRNLREAPNAMSGVDDGHAGIGNAALYTMLKTEFERQERNGPYKTPYGLKDFQGQLGDVMLNQGVSTAAGLVSDGIRNGGVSSGSLIRAGSGLASAAVAGVPGVGLPLSIGIGAAGQIASAYADHLDDLQSVATAARGGAVVDRSKLFDAYQSGRGYVPVLSNIGDVLSGHDWFDTANRTAGQAGKDLEKYDARVRSTLMNTLKTGAEGDRARALDALGREQSDLIEKYHQSNSVVSEYIEAKRKEIELTYAAARAAEDFKTHASGFSGRGQAIQLREELGLGKVTAHDVGLQLTSAGVFGTGDNALADGILNDPAKQAELLRLYSNLSGFAGQTDQYQKDHADYLSSLKNDLSGTGLNVQGLQGMDAATLMSLFSQMILPSMQSLHSIGQARDMGSISSDNASDIQFAAPQTSVNTYNQTISIQTYAITGDRQSIRDLARILAVEMNNLTAQTA